MVGLSEWRWNPPTIVAKRLSGCRWDVGWSEGAMDAEESGKFMEKGELSCVGKSEESKIGEQDRR